MERSIRSTRASLAASAGEFAEAVDSAIGAGAANGPPTALLVARVDPQPRFQLDQAAQAAVGEQAVELIRRNLRHGDVVFHAGDEIVVLLPETPADEARRVAFRLSAAVRGHGFGGGASEKQTIAATLSVGIAVTPLDGTERNQLAESARSACSHVRTSGGDGAARPPISASSARGRQLEIERFVGRSEELRRLRQALDEAAGGSPRAVAVLGEAGSGRGSLLRQLEAELRLRGGSFITARARNDAVKAPYAIWTDVLQALLRLPDAPAKGWRELTHLNSRIPGTGEERAGSKFRLLDELAEYVRLCARSRPLMLVLEEMQWVDGGSWDALDHLLMTIERERLLVCFTAREDAGHTEMLQRREALQRNDYYEEIRLSRLTRDEVKRWLEAAMQRQEVGREPLAYLYRQTEGNPLFLVELVSCMWEEGSIRHTGTKWEWSPVSELRLPNGLDEIIRRRVSRFSEPAQEVLGVAAVIGRELETDVLRAAVSADGEVVRAALRDAVSSGLLRPTYERGGGGLAFAHVRVAEAIASALPPDRLARAHERVARATADRPDAVAGAALHFDMAGCHAEAYAYALRAAARAENLYAYDTAGAFLQIAARNALSPAELAEVRVRMANMAETLGRFDETEELCDLAIEWFSSRGDRLRALTLRRMRERARRELGQPAKQTLQALRALDEEAQALGSDQERVEILTMESQTYARLGDPSRAERLAEECVQMAERVGDMALLANALNRLGITVRTHSPKRARECFERALELFHRVGDVRGQARCHNNLGITQLDMRPESIRESLTLAMTLARAAGMPDLSGTAALNLGVVMQRIGDHDSARRLFGEAMGLFAAVKNSELQLYALYNLANVERDVGNYESGVELYDATSSLAQRIGLSEVEIGALAGGGLCLLAMGKLDEVRVHAAEIEQRMAGVAAWFEGREIVDAFRVRKAVAEGRVADAMAAFEAARREAEQVDLYSVAWLTAAVAELLLPHYSEQMRAALQKYSGQVAALGFTELLRRYDALQGRPPAAVS